MAFKNKILPIPLTSIASSTVSGTYQAINASGLNFPCVIVKIVNNSTKDVTVSYDGVNDHDFVPSMMTVLYSFQNNALPPAYVAELQQGTVLYVKGTAGTGSVYLVGFYQPAGGN